jgi:UDP-glucose 4-epimerase
MRVLVTGGAGRLGYEVAKLCSLEGYQVRAFDLPHVQWAHIEALRGVESCMGDITDPVSVSKACEGIDAVIHLAALLPPRSEVNRDLTLKVNVEGTRNIIKSLNPNSAIVFTSSIATYGVTAHEAPPIRENHLQAAHDNYSESKIQAENIIKNAENPWNILRIAPISVADLLELPDVVPYRGDQRVEFIFVDDAAHAIKACLDMSPSSRDVFNIAGGSSWQMTGAEYIEKFYEALGVEVEPAYSNEYTAVDWYDTEKSRGLGYQRTSFNQLEEKLVALGEELELR